MSKIYMSEIAQFISRYTLLNRSVCLLFNKPFFKGLHILLKEHMLFHTKDVQ